MGYGPGLERISSKTSRDGWGGAADEDEGAPDDDEPEGESPPVVCWPLFKWLPRSPEGLLDDASTSRDDALCNTHKLDEIINRACQICITIIIIGE